MAKAVLIALAVTLGLAACADPAPPPPPAPPFVAFAPPPAPPPPPPPAEPDTCGRAEYAVLVGRNRSEIPVFPNPSRVRVACTSCPMTMDHRLDRLNILFDQATGVIGEVRCG